MFLVSIRVLLQSRVFSYPGDFWSIKTQELACCVVFLLQGIYNLGVGVGGGGRGVCLTVIEHCAQRTIVKYMICTVLFRGRRNGQRYEQ